MDEAFGDGEEMLVFVTRLAVDPEFMSGCRGVRLIATCDVDKSGRSLGFYTVSVTDDLGTPVARMTATCFRRAKD